MRRKEGIFKFVAVFCLLAFAQQLKAGSAKSSLQHCQQLLMAAATEKNKEVSYIVSGDSTRQNSFNFMLDYYQTQLGKINVRVINNSSSGLDAKDWNANVRKGASLEKAITNTAGQGENTILEYSFGINDQGRKASKSEMKKRFKEGILKYLVAKPKATVLLVCPVAHGSEERGEELKLIYQELAAEMDLVFVDALAATGSVLGDSGYYADATHPNQWGSRRVVNYILDQIFPKPLYSVVTLDEAVSAKATDDRELFGGVEQGYYSESVGHKGEPVNHATSWRLQEITVEPNFVLKIRTGAKTNRAFFMDAEGVFLSQRYLGQLGRKDYLEVVIPPSAVRLRLTLSIDAPAYDPKKDSISVKYHINKVNYMSIDDINKGLDIRLKRS